MNAKRRTLRAERRRPAAKPTAASEAIDELWRLGKSPRVAVCRRLRHPKGLELRLDVNGDTIGTRIEPTPEAAVVQSAFLRQTMLATGWISVAE